MNNQLLEQWANKVIETNDWSYDLHVDEVYPNIQRKDWLQCGFHAIDELSAHLRVGADAKYALVMFIQLRCHRYRVGLRVNLLAELDSELDDYIPPSIMILRLGSAELNSFIGIRTKTRLQDSAYEYFYYEEPSGPGREYFRNITAIKPSRGLNV